jgi:hypothetical protein
LPHTGHWFDHQGKIAEAIGLEGFNVHILGWSERNSVSDRRKAADVLRVHLDECLKSSPDAEHFVVAHSHGGNIASMAFSQMEEADSLRRIHFAAISTPFIWFHIRDLPDAMKQSVLLVLFIGYCIALGFSILTGKAVGFLLPDELSFLSAGVWHFLRTASKWVAGIISFFIFSLPLSPVMMLDEKLPSFLTGAEKVSSSRIMARLGSVLILQPPADEAWLGLTIPALGMWINRGIGWILSRAWKSIAICGVIALLAMEGMAATIVHLSRDPRFDPSDALLNWSGIFFKLSAWLLVMVPAQGILWFALAVLGGLTLRFLGYGFFEGVALSISTDVHVEHYPAGGPWKIFCPSQRIVGLHHALYESPEVQVELAKWLKKK